MMTLTKLDAQERHEVHGARVKELISGEISGKEFIASLISQVEFSETEAREQYEAVRGNFAIAIYAVRTNGYVSAPIKITDKDIRWRDGRVTSFYGANRDGAIVEIDGLRVPFSLFELRVKQ